MKIYLGCDLFTEGQRWQAEEIQKALEKEFSDIEIYNPAKKFTNKRQIIWIYNKLRYTFGRL